MQNPNMAAMAQMNAGQGPMDGTPVMANGQRPTGPGNDGTSPRDLLHTYIYEYFCRSNQRKIAQAMLDEDLVQVKPKTSPRNANGIDPTFGDMPVPHIPVTASEQSFLLDWWVQFWDIFSAARNPKRSGPHGQYVTHAREAMTMQNAQRAQRMQMQGGGVGGMNGVMYQNMLQRGPNGVPPNDLKRAAAMNNRPNGNPMPNMNQMKNQAMMSAQMQRDGSQMDMNGQRPQSPGSNENGASPNKRPRVEGTNFNSPRMALARSQGLPHAPMEFSGPEANHMPFAGAMNAGNMPGNQFGEFAQQGPNAQQKQIEVYAQRLAHHQKKALNDHQGMNNIAQGSPMHQPGLPGEGEIFAGNQARTGMPAGAQPPQGNHALQDYQMQLMLLEQQNKKRLLMARQEQDSMSTGPHAQGPVGGPGFPQSMSPQGSRAGPSPNPSDQMKKGTPRMGPQGLPGSPMPEGGMQRQGGSPAPGVVSFDHNSMPPGMPPQYGFPNGMNPQMMRPPSSHPGFPNGQMTPEMQQAMQRNQMAAMQNGGAWRGPPGPGMMPGQQQMGPMGANPQQNRQMPPPPAPAGEQPRAQEPSPSQPAAPPTPSQGNKPKPNKKNTKDNKKPGKKGQTGATPAASGGEEPQTPTAPITPSVHPNKSFGQGPNGQQPPQAAQPQQPAQQQQTPMDNSGPGAFGQLGEDNFDNLGLGFDDSSALENFDFDSFLHVGDDSTGFGSLGADFGFEGSIEAGGIE
ncbi:hypothetical protein BU23DRAFT_127975 [Bimuria novae-zelandiae CBS 107.79]|uniref:LisH domain-containing protein n=1 Tax=Bimuria novae-zelandiae CBS 107.79 TaxID=1447943 RepID=A0A6A5V940_9PLEO|nr:hypothetical protein BU23DRAFT_127975 [Bimuria novae-zelandiae CBS 107.79]